MRVHLSTAIVLSLATAAVAMMALPALAGQVSCDGSVTGLGLTEDQAISAWQQQASASDGAAYANFDLARGKSWSSINLALAVEQVVTASPCKPVRLVQISDLGTLKLQPLGPQGGGNTGTPVRGLGGRTLKPLQFGLSQ